MNAAITLGKRRWTFIALIPSVYGLILFAATFALFELRLIESEPLRPESTFLCLFAMTVFLLSAVLHSAAFRSEANALVARMAVPGLHDPVLVDRTALSLLHIIGFLGLALYIRELIAVFGSPLALAASLLNTSHEVRWATESIHTVGVQLTYVGWIAIALTACAVARGSVRPFWILLAVLQFAGNLVFIDRTRPTWILVTCGLLMMACRFHRVSTAQLVRVSLVTGLALIFVFVLVGFWVGKISTEDPRLFGATELSPVAQSIYYYLTSSFAYLNRIVDTEQVFNWIPERSLYPLFQTLSALGLTDPPPSQVNDVYYVPFPTNTGTILEPLYRDGGALYATLGLAAIVFTIDSFSLMLLRNGSFMALLAWAHLCFSNLLAFFTPKFNNTPLWMVLFFAACALLLGDSARRVPLSGRIRLGPPA